MNDYIVDIVAGVLLPLIPAYIIFKFLPNTSSDAGVSGPFQGLQIKLGGAFAAYILVLFIVINFIDDRHQNLPKYEAYRITGRLKIVNPGPDPQSTIRFSIQPPEWFLHQDGRFDLTVPVKLGPDGEKTLPSFLVEFKNHQSQTIHLDDDPALSADKPLKKTIDEKKKLITLGEPIVMELERPYSPARAETVRAVPLR